MSSKTISLAAALVGGIEPEAFGFKVATSFQPGVIIGFSFATHAWNDAPGAQALLESIGGILAATITMVGEARERAPTAYRILEGSRGQFSEHVSPQW
jgi:hypothetical protein